MKYAIQSKPQAMHGSSECLLFKSCYNYNYNDDSNSQNGIAQYRLGREKITFAKHFLLIDAHLQCVDKHGDFI